MPLSSVQFPQWQPLNIAGYVAGGPFVAMSNCPCVTVNAVPLASMHCVAPLFHSLFCTTYCLPFTATVPNFSQFSSPPWHRSPRSGAGGARERGTGDGHNHGEKSISYGPIGGLDAT